MAPAADGTAEPLCEGLTRPIPGTEVPGAPAPADPLDTGPAWQSLVLGSIPGVDAILDTISPPLQVIAAVLGVVAALLEVLAAILMGLPDLYRALIMAAYEALKGLIEDIINAGFYFYFDAGGVTSVEAGLDAAGVPTNPVQTFTAGQTGAPPPPPPQDRFLNWAARFSQSFDDPGDQNRPVLSDGASIAAVFIVAAAPSLDALRQALYLLGVLFNIKPFLDALDKYNAQAPDPNLTRARYKPVAPDWESLRLKDIFPPLQGLMALPEMLKGLLLSGMGITSLLAALAQAIQAKVKTLQDLIAVIQGIIDLLEALKSAGLYVLPVTTDQGIGGLESAFASAQNRPPGGFVGGVCLLAAGPGIPGAQMLFNILGQGGALTQLQDALTFEQNQIAAAGAGLDQALANLDTTAAEAAQALATEVESNPEPWARATGMTAAEATASSRRSPAAFAARVRSSESPLAQHPLVKQVDTWAQNAARRGARSLAFGHALGPEYAPPAPPAPEPPPPLVDPDDPCKVEKP